MSTNWDDIQDGRAREKWFLPQIRVLIWQHAEDLVDVGWAEEDDDLHHATDAVIQCKGGGTFAIRIREPGCPFRDLTIRSQRPQRDGITVPTEIDKIRLGSPRFYFYGWSGTGGYLVDWMIVDLDPVRKHGLLDRKDQRRNGDGTAWIAIPRDELEAVGCLIARA